MTRLVGAVAVGAIPLTLAGAMASFGPWWMTALLGLVAVAALAGLLANPSVTLSLLGLLGGIAMALGGRPMEGFGLAVLGAANLGRRLSGGANHWNEMNTGEGVSPST
jgi:hypothetical protein